MQDSTTNAAACDYDIVIAGGGMVGACLALLLDYWSDKKLKVLVVESFPAPNNSSPADSSAPIYSPSFDARSTALSYGSRMLLEPLGVWSTLQDNVSAINHIHVSDRGRLGTTSLYKEEVDWPALGYVVENAWMGNVLLDKLSHLENVNFLAPAEVLSITNERDNVAINVKQGEQKRLVTAQLAVIADGANSLLRSAIGIETKIKDYRQTALIANLSFRRPHKGCAFERFADEGPLALLPLTNSEKTEPRSALVWSLSDERAAHLSGCEDEEFLEALQLQFGNRLGEFTRVGDRFCYPLKLVQAKEQVRRGLVVVGNASHSLHPVAGQGFNLALRDCARLAQVLVDGYNCGTNLGELSLLQDYLQQQQFDQDKTIGFSDKLPELFSHRQFGPSLLRGLGLGLLDILPNLKAEFVHHSAGMQDGVALLRQNVAK